jgi:hypothetical protein
VALALLISGSLPVPLGDGESPQPAPKGVNTGLGEPAPPSFLPFPVVPVGTAQTIARKCWWYQPPDAVKTPVFLIFLVEFPGDMLNRGCVDTCV